MTTAAAEREEKEVKGAEEKATDEDKEIEEETEALTKGSVQNSQFNDAGAINVLYDLIVAAGLTALEL